MGNYQQLNSILEMLKKNGNFFYSKSNRFLKTRIQIYNKSLILIFYILNKLIRFQRNLTHFVFYVNY